MTHSFAGIMSYIHSQTQLKLLHSLTSLSFLIPQKEPAELRVKFIYPNQIVQIEGRKTDRLSIEAA